MLKKIGLFGAFGKMGDELRQLIESNKNLEPAGYYGNGGDNEALKNNSIEDLIEKSDAVVDFSLPGLMSDVLSALIKNPRPFVSGTTGHDNFAKMKQLSNFAPVLWSPNMSVGVNILLNFLDNQMQSLDEFDISVLDIHHKEKIDQPSGTAKMIKQKIESGLPKKKIKTHSLRMGGVFGEHCIMIADQNQTIKLQHTALNRRVFAQGAIFAIEKIANMQKGFYSMQDLLSK